MDAISSVNESDDEPMSTDMLEDIRDGGQSHPSINRREERYMICYRIKWGQEEWKGSLLSTRNMGKGLQKLFKAVVNEISKYLPILGESGSWTTKFWLLIKFLISFRVAFSQGFSMSSNSMVTSVKFLGFGMK